MNKLNIKKNFSLSKLTTLKVGGQAEFLSMPESLCELREIYRWVQDGQLSCEMIGAGSNLLIDDNGLKGLIICTKNLKGSNLNTENGIIEALAGESLPTLSRKAAKSGLKGLEWAVGIPGTVGGAAVMNAGAQGGCIADQLVSIKVLSIKEGKEFEISKEDLKFSYRHSILQEEKLIVLSARFSLEPGKNKEDLTKKTNENLNHRTSTQPYHLPSCGSVFRNPEPYKAGQLIEELGMKGFSIGDAEISNTHANFIVNRGQATAQDVQKLILYIQDRVKEAYGLILYPEVKQLGFD